MADKKEEASNLSSNDQNSTRRVFGILTGERFRRAKKIMPY